MKTAMEQLIEQIEKAMVENRKPYGTKELSDERLFVYELVRASATKLLETEKKQIVEARVTAPTLPSIDERSYTEEAEEYFNNTYKK